MEIKLKYIPPKKWELLEDLIVENIYKFKKITVPTKFVTDLASIPKIFWSIYSPLGKHARAAIIHDFLYTIKEIDRKDADKVFLGIMKIDEVGFVKRHLFYRTVRVFGGMARKSSFKKFKESYLEGFEYKEGRYGSAI